METNRNGMERRSLQRVVWTLLVTLLVVMALFPVGIDRAHAGAGAGASLDLAGNLKIMPTYYANSPAGVWYDWRAYDATGNLLNPIPPEAIHNSGTALAKFVDPLPLPCNDVAAPGSCGAQGTYIPVALPDTTTYPGSDYYEIAIVQYTQQMHRDLPKASKLRGYVQISTANVPGKQIALSYPDATPITIGASQVMAVDNPTYLGPIILAHKGRPVRIKYLNLLPVGNSGDLFIPVDKTIMGAGMGPDGATYYTENRIAIHQHGGDTPWISDGTPHQWTVPVGDTATYNTGESFAIVPDMVDPGQGAGTLYYVNDISGRLMFYHDHALGITRLNVYAGVAAGYVILDDVAGRDHDAAFNALAPGGMIPLVIQDKIFVPADIAQQDSKWDAIHWGAPGDLYYPHVYEINQDPNSFDGTNPPGRWDYGPFFWPIFPVAAGNQFISVSDITQYLPFLDGTYDAANHISHASTTPEAFSDTPVVNGKAYPTLTVSPTVYRFRILNAGNDRFLNLGLYKAVDKNTVAPLDLTTPGTNILCDPANGIPSDRCTEVKMVPFVGGVAPFPTSGGLLGTGWGFPDGRIGGVPDPATAGPPLVQFGTEGGWLPQSVAIPSTPTNYEYNKRSVTVLNIMEHGLLLGNAERADVMVDFSSYPPGTTFILYNDAPAPVPAGDPRLDYYTGNPDFTDVGGAPSTLPGFGPNTRTIMQIVVGPGGGVGLNQASLDAALATAYADSQPRPIVTQKAYAPAVTGMNVDNYAHIYTGSLREPAFSFTAGDAITYYPLDLTNPLAPVISGTKKSVAIGDAVTDMPVRAKAIQELFDPYGRMNATLGTEMPFTNGQNQTTVPLGYTDPGKMSSGLVIDPATERISDGETQIWKITHNGVDTHPVHFHLVNVQLINRVGWDGTIKTPDINEIGWKETVRMNPLEDVIVAVRANAPKIPFGVPNSSRHLNPAIPEGDATDFSNLNPATGNQFVPPVTNQVANYGWEYVWHCHILGHEENDFMRPFIFDYPAVVPDAVTNLSANINGLGQVALNWTDPTAINYTDHATFGSYNNEVGFTIMRSAGGAPFVPLANTLANATGYVDTTVEMGVAYLYQVAAYNAAGTSPLSNIAGKTTPQIALTAPAAGAIYVAPADITVSASAATSTTSVSFYAGATLLGTDNTAPFSITVSAVPAGNYTLTAVASGGGGATSAPVTITVVNFAAPATLTVPVTGAGVGSNILTWASVAGPGISYQLEQSTNAFATAGTLVYSGTATSTAVTVYNSGTYSYRVRAINGLGTASAWTLGSADWVVSIATAVPASLTVPAGSATGSYTVTWGASPTLGATYVLQESTTLDFTASPDIPVTGLFYAFTGKVSGTYYYRIKAVHPPMADSNWITSANPCVVAPPAGTPVSLTVPPVSSSGTYTVSWGASPTPAATYTLEESTTVNFAVGTTSVVTTGLTATSAVVTGKVSGTYFYRVSAIAPGYSASSAKVAANGCTILITTLTTPLNGSSFVQGAPIALAATPATPAGYVVSQVDFYSFNTLLGSDTTAPYEYSWTTAPLGAQNLSAVVTYTNGTVSMSPVVGIVVTGAMPVTIDTPLNGSTYDLGSIITITVTPTIVVGTPIILVEFYDGAVWLGFDTTAPYSYNWTPATAGAHSLTAMVYYNNGATSTSAPVAVNLNSGAAAPATITVPATSATGDLTVSWSASTTAGATYTLEESTDNFLTYPANSTVVASGLTATSASITGRSAGATYSYRVKAVKAPLADSVWTTGGNGCLITICVAPASITVPATSATGDYTVSWGTSTNGVAYVLQEATNAAFTTGLRQAYSGTGTSASITGRSSGVTYYYRVRATRPSYTPSAWVIAGNNCIVTLAVVAPAGITVPATDATGSYTVSWGASTTAGISYVLQEATNATFTTGLRQTYSGTGTSANITGRSSGVTYYYQVRAVKPGYSPSTWTVGANGCLVTLPATAPASITVPATNTTGSYTVSWSASTTAGVSYVLQEATNATFTTGLRQAYSGTGTSASITGRSSGVTYYYQVRAVKVGYTSSAWTVGANGCLVTLTAAAPASVTVPATGSATGGYTVSWSASTTAGVSYVLQEATNAAFTAGLRQAYSGTGTSASITGRSAGVTYYYHVRAVRPGYTPSAWVAAGNGCLTGP